MLIRPGMFISDRYEIIDKVGSGGMADVYKAKCHRLNRFVAIKVLKAEYSDDKKFVRKFRAEAQSAAGLSHPNIVNVYDVGEEDDIHYIVMELVEGITLKSYVERKGKLAIKEAVGIAIQIAQGMEAAHSNHIIHRDIKPQNIIISKDGKVKVTDFGIAKVASSDTITSNAMGSVHYISPEQARGGFSDEKSDIYSLGVTLYEMLTGRVPFVGDNTVSVALLHLQEDAIPLRTLEPDIPVSLDRIVQKCMQKKPERRYLVVSDLIADLKRSLSQPDGEYIKLVLPTTIQDSPTIEISDDDLDQIKLASQNFGETREIYSDDNRNGNARKEIEEEEDDLYEEEDETEEENVDPKLEKLMVAGGVVAAVILVLIVIFIIGKLSGIFPGGNGASKIENSPTPTVSQAEETPEASLEPTEEAAIPVPEVVGMDIAEAKAKLENLGLYVSTTEEVSETKAKGYVLSQDLGKDSFAKEGDTIHLVVSSGKQAYQVPDVYGRSDDEAKTILAEAGYAVLHDYEYSDTVQKDYVIRTTPEKGASIHKGDTVTIVLSRGAEEKYVTVPNLYNQAESSAKSQLEKLGLTCTSVSYTNSDTVAKGKVISQTYTNGSSVKVGTDVGITVSLGKKPEEVTYKYIGNITINYNPFDYEDEVGTIKLVLKQDGKSKIILEEDKMMGDFPLSVPGIEGYSETRGEVIMYLDGHKVGDTYSISFSKVAQ